MILMCGLWDVNWKSVSGLTMVKPHRLVRWVLWTPSPSSRLWGMVHVGTSELTSWQRAFVLLSIGNRWLTQQLLESFLRPLSSLSLFTCGWLCGDEFWDCKPGLDCPKDQWFFFRFSKSQVYFKIPEGFDFFFKKYCIKWSTFRVVVLLMRCLCFLALLTYSEV